MRDLKKFIPAHLAKLKEADLSNKVIVYYGFKNDFIREISKKIPFISPETKLFHEDGSLNLEFIASNQQQLVPEIFKLSDDKPHLLMYEELIELLSVIDGNILDERIVVIRNSLVDIVPNQTKHAVRDTEDELLDRDDALDLTSRYYIEAFNLGDIQYVRYKPYKNIKDVPLSCLEIDFFDIPELENSTMTISGNSGGVKKLVNAANDQNNEEYLEILLRIFDANNYSPPAVQLPPQEEELAQLEPKLGLLQKIYKSYSEDLLVFKKREPISHKHEKELKELLKKHWGSSDFRELTFYDKPETSRDKSQISQLTLIEDILDQVDLAKNNDDKDYRDIFITAPTGAGKSLLFQLPSMYLSERSNYLTIVVSPLIALMTDQVKAMKEDRKVDYVAYINSEMPPSLKTETIEQIKDGTIDIVYLSPELLLSYHIESFIGDREIGMLVVDEAHLVTTWGRDFRPDYWYVGNYIRNLRRDGRLFPVIALTATAVYGGVEDVVFQTIKSLNMHAEKIYVGNSRRDEIVFNIKPLDITGNHNLNKLQKTAERIQGFVESGKKAIVYCPWVSQIDEIYAALDESITGKVGKYYGNLDKNEKQQSLNDFKDGKFSVVLATKAFGMGVDVSDIDIVYHHAPSGNMSDYIQEIGRVARDKKRTGYAEVDFAKQDLSYVKILYGLSYVKQFQVRGVIEKLYEIYVLKKNQKFLVSTDDFAYLFGENKEPENLVKSALLLIEKDFMSKFDFQVIIARPKALFSSVYACVEKSAESKFLDQYGKYSKLIAKIADNRRTERGNSRSTNTNVHDSGDIFVIKLDKLWEEKYPHLSFPELKHRFFTNTLFTGIEEDVVPRSKLTIVLKNDIPKTADLIEKYFSMIERVISKMGSAYQSEREIEKIVQEVTDGDRVLARKLLNFIITLFVSSPRGMMPGEMTFDTFIQPKRSPSGELKFRVVASAFSKSRYFFLKNFNAMFSDGKTHYQRFIVHTNSSSPKLKLGCGLEALGLATYELMGGKAPQVFIRVNDPYKLKRIVDGLAQYQNNVLQDIRNRQRSGVAMMEKFFTRTLNNLERWDLIESYFLGESVLDDQDDVEADSTPTLL